MRFFTLLIVAFTLTTASAQRAQMQWYTMEEALELNKKNPKNFFFDIYTDWCGWCKEMDRTTFGDPVVAAYMNENYYSIKLNAEKSDTIWLKGKSYQVEGRTHTFGTYLNQGKRISGFPTVSFADSDVNVLFPVSSYLKAPVFKQIATYAVEEGYKYIDFQNWQTNPNTQYWKQKAMEDNKKILFLKSVQIGTTAQEIEEKVGKPSAINPYNKNGKEVMRYTYEILNQKIELLLDDGKVINPN